MALETNSTAPCPPGANQPGPFRLGVFGGTFDPIHLGHLIIAQEALFCGRLDAVVFVPARVSPLKVGVTSSSALDRFHMVQLAIADNPRFCLSRIELDREGPSFTVDTLRALRSEYGPQTELFFIMGADSLMSLKLWHRPQDIIRLAQIIALTRPEHEIDLAMLEKALPGIAAATQIIDTIHLHISATEIRHRVEKGLPIRYQVPAQVEDYIREHGLYTAEGGVRAPASHRHAPCS